MNEWMNEIKKRKGVSEWVSEWGKKEWKKEREKERTKGRKKERKGSKQIGEKKFIKFIHEEMYELADEWANKYPILSGVVLLLNPFERICRLLERNLVKESQISGDTLNLPGTGNISTQKIPRIAKMPP